MIGLTASAAQVTSAADLAGDLEQRRQRIIRDYVDWSTELAAQHAIDGASPVALADSAAPETQFVSYLQRLTRLRAVEALELGIEHIGLTAERTQGESSPAVDLLVSIGRPASMRLAELLRADPAVPEPLSEALRRIEGEAAESLPLRGVPQAPETASLSATAGGLEIRFLRIPGIPLPEYSGHSTQTVLDLASGERREGPSFAETPLGRTSLATAVDAVQSTGDVALIGEFMIISSGRYARFQTGDLESLAGRDLSASMGDGDAVTILEKKRVWLVQTLDGKYALLQYFGMFDGEALLAYVLQPDGSARFQLAPLLSPAAFRARPGVSAGEMMAHGLLIQQREIAYWKDYALVVDELTEKIVNGTISSTERDVALRHVARLRAAEAAESVVAHLAASGDSTRGTAGAGLDALGAIWPAARPQLLAALSDAEAAGRSRLAQCLEQLDGSPIRNSTGRERKTRGR